MGGACGSPIARAVAAPPKYCSPSASPLRSRANADVSAPEASELELGLDPDLVRLLREELAERQRASLSDDHRADAPRGGRGRPFQAAFEAAVEAPVRRLVVRKRR